MATVEPGKLYYVVECKKCTRAIAFGEAPAGDTEAAKAASLHLEPDTPITCPHCGYSAKYGPSNVLLHGVSSSAAAPRRLFAISHKGAYATHPNSHQLRDTTRRSAGPL